MPIYEYKCPRCGHEYEKLVGSYKDHPKCPRCQSGDTEKKVSVSSFSLKGIGWYKDGYGGK